MGENLSNRHFGLAGHTELRPVVGDPRIDIERAAIGENCDNRGDHPLADREHGRNRVFLPERVRPCGSASQRNDFASVSIHGDCGTDLGSRGEVLGERGGDRLVLRLMVAADLGHCDRAVRHASRIFVRWPTPRMPPE